MNLQLTHFFDASHQLTDSSELVTKQCPNLHGHTYCVKVTLGNAKPNSAGMITDFSSIKQIINRFDHRHINAVLEEMGLDRKPTAENIALTLAELFSEELAVAADIGVSLCEGYKGERSNWVTVNL